MEKNCDAFRLYLQRILVERCGKNPRYSLRAFARSLEISPAALSDMLNGKRTITSKTKTRLGRALGVDPAMPGAEAMGASFSQITLDSFAFISDWYHYAILELMKTESFRPNCGWIARALGISKPEATAAVERLERLGLIERLENGWIDTSGGFSTNIEGSLTSVGSKKLQRQVLEQSLRALEEVPIEKRNHTSMTMAIDSRDLPEAIERIRRFRRRLSAWLESRSAVSEVYQLSISLFPITNLKNQGESQ